MGTHTQTGRKLTAATTLPVAIAILAAGVASAAPPEQPGVAAQPQTAPETTAPPREYLGGYQPPTDIANTPWRTLDDARSGHTQPQTSTPTPAPKPKPAPKPAAPAAPAEPPAPAAPATIRVTRPAIVPIDAPPNTILIGKTPLPRPDFIDERLAQQFNNTVAAGQAQVGNALVSLGVRAPQADRITAGAVTGGLIGGATGAVGTGAVLGAIGAGEGAVIGALVGFGVGAATTGIVAPITLPTGVVLVGSTAGALAGAGIGAAVGGVALGALGTGIGLAAGTLPGAVLGATVLGGSDTTVSVPADPPSSVAAGIADQHLVAEIAARALATASAAIPPELANPMADTTNQATRTLSIANETINEHIHAGRELIESVEGGPEAIALLDSVSLTARAAIAPLTDAIARASTDLVR